MSGAPPDRPTAGLPGAAGVPGAAEVFLDPGVIPAETRRRAARAILLDDRGRCLVERIRMHDDLDQGTWWELPGGGLEPGEVPAEAVARELAEETGYADVQVGPALASRRVRFRGRRRVIVDQHETFHVVSLTTDRSIPARPDPGEGEDILEVAWVPVSDLGDGRRVDPPELVSLVADAADGRFVPRRLADLDALDWGDDRPAVALSVDGAAPHVVADRIVRDAAPWTPAVHALLGHLEGRGFDGAPRALGIDVCGREAVTCVPGQTGGGAGAMGDRWADPLLTVDGMAAVGGLLRRLRDAVEGFVAPADAIWRTGPGRGLDPAAGSGGGWGSGAHLVGAGETVAHGDVGWTNLVWGAGGAPALIDWEFAQPAPPLRDLAQAACWLVPLVEFDHEARGFDRAPDRAARLRALASSGSTTVDDLLDAVAAYVTQERERISAWGARGIEAWAGFLQGGWLDGFDRVLGFLDDHAGALR